MHFRLGQFQLDVVSDGTFRIDGGTLFGVVPRVLWEKLSPPDEQNRIALALKSLLVRTEKAAVLVDTGLGTKLSAKARQHHNFSEGALVEELGKIGVRPGDIDVVINTHLHFDHAGGNTAFDERRKPRPTFPNATYVIQKQEWEDATHADGLTRAGYHAEDFAVLAETGQLRLIEGDEEVAPGVTCRLTGGHTRGHQMVLVRHKGLTACYPGDVMPSTAHIKPNFITAYDLHQEKTYAVKVKLIDEACEGRWVMVWGHDTKEWASRLAKQDDRVVATPVRTTE
jgi:glyoxylase-like metal-dependent hydrolase (beta-lactamase superfamily II)